MALNKVEICGVNTSKLPLLKEEEKEELCGEQRKSGRSVSDWLYRPDKGGQQF